MRIQNPLSAHLFDAQLGPGERAPSQRSRPIDAPAYQELTVDLNTIHEQSNPIVWEVQGSTFAAHYITNQPAGDLDLWVRFDGGDWLRMPVSFVFEPFGGFRKVEIANPTQYATSEIQLVAGIGDADIGRA